MKRILAAICALTMLAATLSGCSAPPAASTSGGNSAPPAQSPAPAGPVTIRLYGLNAAWSAVMDQAAADYNRETGNTLEVEIAGDDYSAVLAARFNSNQAPDIFELANSDILAWADRLADVSGCKFSEALYDSAKSSAYVDGVCYGMPCGISAGGFVYNKDLFDQAGITKLPKTLDELEETCIQLQQAGIQPFGEAWKEWGYLAQLFGYAFLYEDDTRVLADRLNSGGMQLADLAHIGDFFRLYDMTLDYGLGEQSIGYGVYDQVADFAADMELTGLLVGHDALGCGHDGDTQAAQHPGQLLGAGIHAQAGLGHPAQVGDDLLLAGLDVLQGDADDALGPVADGLEVLDIALVQQNLGDGLLHVGSGDIHGVMLGVVRVADAGEHIRNGIGDLHETLPPV